MRYDGNNQGRINQGGPGLSWKDTVLTDNTFILPGYKTNAVDLPPFESFYRMTASGNRFFAGKAKKRDRTFSVRGKAASYDDFIRAVGDESASFVEEPFRNREKATVGFRENASVSNAAGLPNYIPVAVSEPMEKPISVSYILWNADMGEEICRGVLDFDPYQCEKGIYIGEGGINVLAELAEGRGIHPGEQLIHLQTARETEREYGTSPRGCGHSFLYFSAYGILSGAARFFVGGAAWRTGRVSAVIFGFITFHFACPNPA